MTEPNANEGNEFKLTNPKTCQLLQRLCGVLRCKDAIMNPAHGSLIELAGWRAATYVIGGELSQLNLLFYAAAISDAAAAGIDLTKMTMVGWNADTETITFAKKEPGAS